MASGGGHRADLRSVVDAGTGSDAGTVPVPYSRLSFRQRFGVHQPHRGADAEQTVGGTNQVAARAIATTTGWWKRKTARWVASTTATVTSPRRMQRLSMSSTACTSIPI